MAVSPRDLTVTFEVREIPKDAMAEEFLRAQRISQDEITRAFGVPAYLLVNHDVEARLRAGTFHNISIGYRVVDKKLELDSYAVLEDTPFVHPNCRCAMIALETPDMDLTPPKVAAPKRRRSTTAILADLKKVAAKRNTVIREGNEIHRKLGDYVVERERLTNLVADLNAEFNASFSIETGGSK